MVDGLEEVVLDLVVDSSEQMKHQRVAHAPIRRATHLMFAPTNLLLGMVQVLRLVIRVRDVVDHDKAKTERQALDEQCQKAIPSNQAQGQHVARQDEDRSAHLLPLEERHHVGQGVQEPDVPMLVADVPAVGVAAMQPEKWVATVGVKVLMRVCVLVVGHVVPRHPICEW